MKPTKLKILAICSRNKRRSLTAETIFRGHPDVEVRSAGTSPKARHQVSNKDIEWADLILCMETKHKQQLQRIFGKNNLPSIRVLDIDDVYSYMDEELCDLLKEEIEQLANSR